MKCYIKKVTCKHYYVLSCILNLSCLFVLYMLLIIVVAKFSVNIRIFFFLHSLFTYYTFLSSYLLVDPCEQEERVKDGLLVIAMNKHREICSIQSSGGIMLLKDQVRVCANNIFLA